MARLVRTGKKQSKDKSTKTRVVMEQNLENTLGDPKSQENESSPKALKKRTKKASKKTTKKAAKKKVTKKASKKKVTKKASKKRTSKDATIVGKAHQNAKTQKLRDQQLEESVESHNPEDVPEKAETWTAAKLLQKIKEQPATTSQRALDELTTNIATGKEVDSQVLNELRQRIPNQADKIDLVTQVATAQQSQRLARYMQAAGMVEEFLFYPEVLGALEPKDLIKVFELIQKHIVQITDFVESKSANPPIPAMLKQLLDMDKGHAERIQATRSATQGLDSTSREKIRGLLSMFKDHVSGSAVVEREQDEST